MALIKCLYWGMFDMFKCIFEKLSKNIPDTLISNELKYLLSKTHDEIHAEILQAQPTDFIKKNFRTFQQFLHNFMPSLIYDHNANKPGSFRHIDPNQKNHLTRELNVQ